MQCERCPSEAVRKERFCPKCRKLVLEALRNSNYLTPRPYTPYRSGFKRQAAEGDPSPWNENAVRALEDVDSEPDPND